jgi:osmotically inducible protein OsmC
MAIKRTSSAVWNGTGLEGNGEISSTSGLLNNTPYSVATRFKSEDGRAGTNPEELIAAAHAACFCMALSFQLAGAGFPPTKLATKATVEIDTSGPSFTITHILLELTGVVENITAEKFAEIAEEAKNGCPISKALSAVPMTLNANLEA